MAKKTHVFMTLENAVKLFQYAKTPIKINKVWLEDQIEAMKEAGIFPDLTESSETKLTEETLELSNLDSQVVDPEILLEEEESEDGKPSGAVQFSRE